jgi:DNA-binding CsgD family transcriptional regulator
MNKSDFLNVDVLSAREREVARFAADGFANKMIARKLNIAEGTVKIHLHRVYKKLGIKSRLTLASLTAKIGSTDPSAAKHDRIRQRFIDPKTDDRQKFTFVLGRDVKIQRKQ